MAGRSTRSPMTYPGCATWITVPDGTSGFSASNMAWWKFGSNFSPSGYRIGRFSIASQTGSGFPHGFELQLIGPSSARQLLLRVISVSTNVAGATAFAEIQAILDARDI